MVMELEVAGDGCDELHPDERSGVVDSASSVHASSSKLVGKLTWIVPLAPISGATRAMPNVSHIDARSVIGNSTGIGATSSPMQTSSNTDRMVIINVRLPPLSKTKRVRHKNNFGDFCCVPACSNQRGKDIAIGVKRSYHKFPKDREERDRWIKLIRRVDWTPRGWERVCSDHFVGGKRTEGCYPTLFPFYSQATVGAKQTSQADPTATVPRTWLDMINARRTSVVKKADHKRPNECASSTDGEEEHVVVGSVSSVVKDEMQMSTFYNYCKVGKVDVDIPAISPTIADLQYRIDELQKQNAQLQKRLLSLQSVKNNADTFHYYTNLPSYDVFKTLSDYLKGRRSDRKTGMLRWRGYKTNKRHAKTALKPESERNFSFKEEFFVVLVKLTTGRGNRDLGFNFGVSDGLITEIFNEWCCFLQFELKLLFEISDKNGGKSSADGAAAAAAQCSRNFVDLRVIVDCTELILKKTGNLNECKCASSNVKNKDTVKFLVSLSPDLYVNHVHVLTTRNEFENDTDHGLAVSDALKKLGVQLILPSFDVNPMEVTERTMSELVVGIESPRTEQVAKSIISIEHVLQRVRMFRVLSSVVVSNQTDLIERMLVICAYLTNFQLPIA